MFPTIFRYLAAQYPDFDLAGVRRTPDIASFNWITGTIHGRDQNECRTNYRQCGLCAPGKQEHHEDLISYMCEMDYISVELMGGVLHRTGTLATGASCCDFYVFKKAPSGMSDPLFSRPCNKNFKFYTKQPP